MAPGAMNNRKRSRSKSDFEFETQQSKQFINEKIVNMNDSGKMKQIHDKTLKMLFRNASGKGGSNAANVAQAQVPTVRWQQFSQAVCLLGNGTFKTIEGGAGHASAAAETRRCKYCAKPSSLQAVDCINCNLELCEYCGISCEQCNAPLCMCCVRLFDCCDNAIDMNPCCQRCKQTYLDQ